MDNCSPGEKKYSIAFRSAQGERLRHLQVYSASDGLFKVFGIFGWEHILTLRQIDQQINSLVIFEIMMQDVNLRFHSPVVRAGVLEELPLTPFHFGYQHEQ
jgi:hypothetical protein